MALFAGKYRIESNRWKYWDYSASAAYFITICIADRQCILGAIENNKMQLSNYGEIVSDETLQMSNYHPRCSIDESVVMPNHIHLLLLLDEWQDDEPAPENLQWWHKFPYQPTPEEIIQYRKARRQMLLPKLIGKLKMQTSKRINSCKGRSGIKNWQANYYDHVIRDEQSFARIKQYIIHNPTLWKGDKFYAY